MNFYWCDGETLEERQNLEGFGQKEGRFLCFVDEAGNHHLVLGCSLPHTPEHKDLKSVALKAHPEWQQVGAGYGWGADFWKYSTLSTSPKQPADPAEAAALLKQIQEAAAAAGFGKE
jgi:hypothetical protein